MYLTGANAIIHNYTICMKLVTCCIAAQRDGNEPPKLCGHLSDSRVTWVAGQAKQALHGKGRKFVIFI